MFQLELLPACGLRGGIAAGEFLDSAGRIDKFLFSREERMARSANTDLQIAARGPGVVIRPAGAGNNGRFVTGMNLGFHIFKKGSKQYLNLALEQRKRALGAKQVVLMGTRAV